MKHTRQTKLKPRAVSQLEFYIPATGPAARPRRTLKHDDTFVMLDGHGDIGASPGAHDGLFHRDTRYLSHCELLINGQQPLLLGSNLADDNSILSVDLTNPDIFFDRLLILERDLLHIARTIFLWRGTMFQRFAVRNHGDTRVRLLLSVTFDSDFADVFEVRGIRRLQRGTATTLHEPANATLDYVGLDGVSRRTLLAFEPTPTELAWPLASYRLDLVPGETTHIDLSIACDRVPELPHPFQRGLRKAQQELTSRTQGICSIETSNHVFNEMLRRATVDLGMLLTETSQGLYPYAGIPWYSTTFGRDGLITGLQCLWLDPGIALGVLKRLAAYQATSDDPESDAQPGKILHEMRAGEMATLKEIPFGLYYGSVDATPLFVLLAALCAECTGDLGALETLWPAMERALAWIDGPGDPDQDGFVEYWRPTPRGLANQGWKDSHDAIFHADGKSAEGPIALAEVQGYVFAAKQLAARCARRLGRTERAQALEAQAATLAERFDAAFWCEDIANYALALDRNKKPCRVRTSNGAQVLFSGIARPERAHAIATALMEPHFFSGWGVRTVSTKEKRFNPMSYHNGSVWPHDNALVAAGLARYGEKKAVLRIFQALFEATTYMDLRRLPELFCGFPRYRGRGPTLYPVACAPQAWAAGTFFSLLQSALGLEQDAAAGMIRLHDPCLPEFLDEVRIRNLRLGNASLDLALRREGERVSVEVLRKNGAVEVTTVASE